MYMTNRVELDSNKRTKKSLATPAATVLFPSVAYRDFQTRSSMMRQLHCSFYPDMHDPLYYDGIIVSFNRTNMLSIFPYLSFKSSRKMMKRYRNVILTFS